jgi:hypothetical protein
MWLDLWMRGDCRTTCSTRLSEITTVRRLFPPLFFSSCTYLFCPLLPRTGNVYEKLIYFAQNEPLNKVRFNVEIDDEELEVGPERGTAAWEKTKSKL